MDIILNKDNTLTNLGNSILKRFDCPTIHSSMKDIDEILSHNKDKKVCLILLDGFGKNIIEMYKDYCPFIYNHIFKTINSVFPPTTVAATTSLLTCKYPIETGYIGWSQYFPEHNQFIDVFPSVDSLDKTKVNPPVTEKILKISNLIEIINGFNKYKAKQIMGFNYLDESKNYDLDKLFKAANEALNDNDFVYLYSCEPDHLMHSEGTYSSNLPGLISKLNLLVKNITSKNNDTIFILIADHGMVDIDNIFIDEYPLFYNSLKEKNFFIEGRFAGFFVENEANFVEAYNKYYKNDFIMFSKKEILEKNIFGYSDNINQNALNTLGDYFLVSTGRYSFNNPNSRNHQLLVGNHAGGTIEEREIYLSIYNK